MLTAFRRQRHSGSSRTLRSWRVRPVLLHLEGRVAPATFTVINADDSGPGSLRQAILDANTLAGADDIAFDPTFFNAANPRTIPVLAASGQLTISEGLTINGPGPAIVTVSGGGVVRPFNVDNGATGAIDVILNGMTVTGGNGTSSGGAGDGGGIRSGNENLTLNNMVVTGNSTINDGGGIAVVSAAFLTIRNSTISGNTGRRGGGIYFQNSGSLLMENSTVSGNTATEAVVGGSGGGGIYFFGTVGSGGFTIRNSTLAGNTATNSGGGLLVRGLTGTVRIQNSTVTANTSNATSTTAGHGGGGIAVNASGTNPRLEIGSTIVSGNTATAANGRSDIAANTVTVTVDFSAIGDPDGFTFTGSNNLPSFAVLNLLPLANYGGPTQTVALGVGSAAENLGANPEGLTNDQRGPGFPRVVGNFIDIGAFEGVVDFPMASGGPYAPVTVVGGTTYTFDVTYTGTVPIDVSTLDNNDIRVTGPNGFNQLAEFVSVTPAGNGSPRTATYRITAPGGTFGLEDIGEYQIGLQAGQVANTNGVTAVPRTVGSFRVAIPQTFTVTNLNDTGAGSLRQAILDANAADFSADTIVFQAGLAGSIDLTAAAGQLTITDTGTTGGPGAAGDRIGGSGAGRHFASDNGGRVLDVSISGLTVTGGNGSTGGPTPVSDDGGGIRIGDDRVILDGMVVTGNSLTSANDGGGIALAGQGFLTVRNSTVSDNQAGRGGGIHFANGGALLMENSTVSGNTATQTEVAASGGGGIDFGSYVTADGFTIRNSTIASNTAFGSGGGLNLRVFGQVRIQNSTITGNAANTTSTTAADGGGGIVFGLGFTPFVNLESTIVSGNTASAANGRSDIAAASFSPINVNFSAIGDPDGFTLTGTSGNNLPFGTALGLGPLASNGGPTMTVSIAANSPARNAGTNPANLTTDQRGTGFVRVNGPTADIGAFEFQPATAPRVTAVTVNADQSNATQRSRVTSIAVTFSAAVTFAGTVGEALQLSRIGGGAVGGFTAVANVIGGVTVVTLSGFTGAETRFGSLVDGRYQLTVLANQVSAGGLLLDGDGNGSNGDDFVQDGSTANGLFSFYGDVNGDGIVNAADFGPFRAAFGTSVGNPLYRDFLDFNNDGTINATDFAQFRIRFGATVP